MPVRDKPAPFFPQIMMTIFQVQTMFKKEKKERKGLIRIKVQVGPVPQKMVKFKPGLSQILSKVYLSKNMQFELSKYCSAFTPRYRNDNTKCYSTQYILTKEGKIQKRKKILIMD